MSYTTPAPHSPVTAPATAFAAVDVRVRISGLWTAILFVFAYVDLFSLYRADVRADLEAGRVSAFAVTDLFLTLTTLYVIVPAVMIALTLFLSRRVGRPVMIATAAVYALTITVGAVGERPYYVLGSVVQVALLALLGWTAWRWESTVPTADTDAQ